MIQVNGEIERRIDYVGEPGHAQPQDPPSNNQPNRSGRLYDGTSSDSIGANIIPKYDVDDYDDDLQQRQQPIFAKGTYLEFVQQ